MFNGSSEPAEPITRAVVETVQGSLTHEELEFGSQPNGELLGRYALETFIDLVSVSSDQ